MSENASLHIERTKLISFKFDGMGVAAHDGETIAAALFRAGITHIRNAPSGTPRGMFCAMGVCQECVVNIDGKIVEACRTTVQEGQDIQKVEYV